MNPKYYHFDSTPWVDEAAKKGVPKEVYEAAQKAGARRKMLANGETGIYVQYSDLPPGWRIEPHSHSHDEVIMLLAGSCVIDGGEEMHAKDAICLKGGFEYGFTAGKDGMSFLTIRGGDSITTFAK